VTPAVVAELTDVALAAARAAGAELLSRYDGPARGVRTKRRPGDWVSEADLAAERIISDTLAKQRANDGLVAEEATADRPGGTGVRWVVDPLDGTANFLTGIPLWCVSVACEDALGTCVGVIFDPLRGELFAAARGGDATLNGQVLRGGDHDSLEASCIAGCVQCFTGAEATRHRALIGALYRRTGQRRALGSAALELAWTAAGRLDICYQEQDVYPWDVDAGLFICQRAGLRTYRLEPLRAGLAPRFLAAPGALAPAVLDLVSAAAPARPPAPGRGSVRRPERRTGSQR
jgi:myo-inositol-1(or 4)-monophosphatase